jgi:hypothetical protein
LSNLKNRSTGAVFLCVKSAIVYYFLFFYFCKKEVMDVTAFFNQLDDTARSKDIAQKAKEAKLRVVTEMTVAFANKLAEFVRPYEAEFAKRNWKCDHRTGNLPYWSFEVRNPVTSKSVKIAIVHSQTHEYEIATYRQELRIHNSLYLLDGFDSASVAVAMQDLFSYLV